MMFVRRSTTCLLPVGKMDYRDEGEKQEFVKIPTYGHPGVGMVPNDYPVGDFRDHFK
jgi:hypothetical protein